MLLITKLAESRDRRRLRRLEVQMAVWSLELDAIQRRMETRRLASLEAQVLTNGRLESEMDSSWVTMEPNGPRWGIG